MGAQAILAHERYFGQARASPFSEMCFRMEEPYNTAWGQQIKKEMHPYIYGGKSPQLSRVQSMPASRMPVEKHFGISAHPLHLGPHHDHLGNSSMLSRFPPSGSRTGSVRSRESKVLKTAAVVASVVQRMCLEDDVEDEKRMAILSSSSAKSSLSSTSRKSQIPRLVEAEMAKEIRPLREQSHIEQEQLQDFPSFEISALSGMNPYMLRVGLRRSKDRSFS